MPEPVLRNAPLNSVVCELRFQGPAERLRPIDLAPLFSEIGLTEYEREQGMQLQMTPGQLGPSNFERHRFAKVDGSALLTVAEGIFSYEENVYQGIDAFLATWEPLASALAAVLEIEARTRLGLRYVNEVKLSGDDRDSVEAAVEAELLPPWGANENLETLAVSLHELRFRQSEGEIAFRHGLQRGPGQPPVYLLDYDHYEQYLRAIDVPAEVARLRAFNARVETIFRWSITDASYESFEPQERGDA